MSHRAELRRQWRSDNDQVQKQFGAKPMSWQLWLSYLDEPGVDADAIRADWEAVGDDLRSVLNAEA